MKQKTTASALHLRDIVDGISFDTLPPLWQGFDLVRFSPDKALFEFQRQGLQNALKGLWLYYANREGDKRKLFFHYRLNNLTENFDYSLLRKENKKTAGYLLEYDNDYPAVDSKISFAHFINRMSFWMATGSGKTLVIVKLIEFLGKLIAEEEIPTRDILFLTHRDDLLEQFKRHVEEFNLFNFNAKIRIKNLKDYENVKRGNAASFFKNEITVFYYRSDLISDRRTRVQNKLKAKIVDFRNYDNNGRWYILLDEAHKGDREESKRQVLYSILSRNGFLFNFSATFTDPRDFATCVFNFNLSRFVEKGYGKHIHILSADVSAFRTNDDFSPVEKQKIVLKTLVLLTYINKHFEKIRKVDNSLYHRPLLLTLVNSVNKSVKGEEPDLELFFRELEKVARNEIRGDLLERAKQELISGFKERATFEFENALCEIDASLISALSYRDILRHVMHAKTPGNIEVLKIPGNKNELIFRLMTTEKPFALIKIGDISPWLKQRLRGYEINESFENTSYFANINRDDSDIHILMGSRSFYEGWDSNRPNVLLFINIGVGKNAKKFVLQSVGRGVRIEPRPHHRKRLLNLYNEKTISEELYTKLTRRVLPLESVFVFGTNAGAIKEIISTLKDMQQNRSLGDAFALNPEAHRHSLLIPIFRTSEKIFADKNDVQRYPISSEDLDLAANFCDFLGDKIAVAIYNCPLKVLQKARKSFQARVQEDYYSCEEENSLQSPERILGRIFDYFSVQDREFDTFQELQDEIVHFKEIRYSGGEKYDEIKQNIEIMKEYPKKKRELANGYGKIPQEEYAEQLLLFKRASAFEVWQQKVGIKYLANHYYLPVIVSESEKIDFLNHIIDVASEVKFIRELEEYLENADNVFRQFDWWMFSKLDQTLDDICIPYYNPRNNRIANFKPDFIFWLQKGNHYWILFVDPKSTEYSDAYRKIDGYSRIFEQNERDKAFSHNGLTIHVKLLLKPRQGIVSVPAEYRRHWFDNLGDIAQKIRV